MNSKIIFVIIIFITILTISGYFLFNFRSGSNLSHPLSNQIINTSSNDQAIISYAFLPYWNVSQVNLSDITPYTHLAYFGIEPDAQGDIKKLNTPTQAEPGWHTFKQPSTQQLFTQAKSAGVKNHIVIKLFDYQTLTELLNNPSSTDNLISTLINLVDEYDFDGINIDFEPNQPVSSTTSDQFTQFITQLNQKLKLSNPQAELVVDVYSSAASKNHIWQVSQLSPHLDYFIVMAYDYYRSSSSHTGPVAPIFQKNNSKNIMSHLKQFSDIIPPSQIVLGIPFYGYQWQTVSDQFNSPTYPKTGTSISLKKIQPLLNNSDYILHWNQETLSHWLSFTDQKNTYQIHFDSPESIKLKLELIRQAGLKGVAIWALGYQPTDFDLNP